MLTADVNADLLNPNSWKKSAEPVFKQSPENGVFAPGHNSFLNHQMEKKIGYFIMLIQNPDKVAVGFVRQEHRNLLGMLMEHRILVYQ